jgi:hypothetical protein
LTTNLARVTANAFLSVKKDQPFVHSDSQEIMSSSTCNQTRRTGRTPYPNDV